MNPVSEINLAASVIQLMKFGFETLHTIRELHQHESINSYDDVKYTTNHLNNLTESLQHSLQGSNTQLLSKEEKNLIDLNRRCQDCAFKLQHELRKLRPTSHPSTLMLIQKVARAIWKKDKIEEIKIQLTSFQSTLETSLLHRLRYVPLYFLKTSLLRHWRVDDHSIF